MSCVTSPVIARIVVFQDHHCQTSCVTSPVIARLVVFQDHHCQTSCITSPVIVTSTLNLHNLGIGHVLLATWYRTEQTEQIARCLSVCLARHMASDRTDRTDWYQKCIQICQRTEQMSVRERERDGLDCTCMGEIRQCNIYRQDDNI